MPVNSASAIVHLSHSHADALVRSVIGAHRVHPVHVLIPESFAAALRWQSVRVLEKTLYMHMMMSERRKTARQGASTELRIAVTVTSAEEQSNPGNTMRQGGFLSTLLQDERVNLLRCA